MKLLITGSRLITGDYYQVLCAAIRAYYPNATQIWHGGAKGADQLAQRYCNETGVPCRVLMPDYKNAYYKAAPLRRNKELVRMTDATLALVILKLEGGTKHTAELSRKAGHRTLVVSILTGNAIDLY